MAEADANIDDLCCEFFQMCVEKEQAKQLPLAEKKMGKGTTVRKILKDACGESSTVISTCEASVMSKHQDRKTKKISDVDFVKLVLPDLAGKKLKVSQDDPKAQEECMKMKRKMVEKLNESKNPQTTKNAAVVDRLTDTSKYTGSHQARFDKEGKGKGKEGREDTVKNTGYVGAYKGEGTHGKKH